MNNITTHLSSIIQVVVITVLSQQEGKRLRVM